MGVRHRSGVGGKVCHRTPPPAADISMPDTRRTFPVLLVTSHRYMGLTLANDAKPAMSWATRISFARGEWIQDTRSPPRGPPDLRQLARGVPPPGRQATSSHGPTHTVKHISPLPPPTAMLCSHIVPTLTPPQSTTATTMATTTTTTRRSNSHSRRSSTSSSRGTTTSNSHSRRCSTSSTWGPTTSNRYLRRRSTSNRWHRTLTGSSRHRHHSSSISTLQAMPRPLPLRLLPEHLRLLRPRCIY